MNKRNDYGDQQGGNKDSEQNSSVGCAVAGCGGLIVLFFFLVLLIPWGRGSQEADENPQVSTVAETERKEGWLRAKTRFSEYEESDRLFPAQEALNEGDVITAVKLNGARNAIEYPDTDRERRFGDAVQLAMNEQSGRGPADDFAYQVNKNLLPELNAINTKQATFSNEDKLLSQFEEFERVLDDLGSTEFEGGNKIAFDRFVARLRAKQEEIYPILRKARIAQMRSVLFRTDVEVSGSGLRNDRVTFVGWAYGRNASIEDNFRTIEKMLSRLRFKKATFKTPIRSSKYYTYTLETPKDGYVKLPE